MPAADRMQHFDAYIDPVTHQVQQTIYLARRNPKPQDNTDLFEIISWTKPRDCARRRRAGQVQAEGRRRGSELRDLMASQAVTATVGLSPLVRGRAVTLQPPSG